MSGSDVPCPWWVHHRALLRGLRCDEQNTLHADGHRFTPHAQAQALDSASPDDDPRVEALHHHLYRHYYAGIGDAELGDTDDDDSEPPDTARRSASSARSVWLPPASPALVSGPWRVLEQLSRGAVVARRGILVRWLEAGEYVFDGTPARAARRDLVQRHRPRTSQQLDPAFLYLFGEAESDACSDDAMVRYYFAPRPARLEGLITILQRTLDQAGLPFSLKYPRMPQALWRRDAVVLYAAARHAPQMHARLSRLAPELRPLLRAVHGLWVQPLLPGLGFAQDPDTGLSFGESRCLALARGMLNAALAGQDDALEAVEASFAAAGIDWEAPYLDRDADDRFGLRRLTFTPDDRRRLVTAPDLADERLWRETIAIGNQLCADALWYGSACTWISDDADDHDGQLAAYTRSMNGNLYDGSLGVAAYLTQLASQSGDSAHRDTATGALWHALGQSPSASISLYEGRLGVVTQGAHLAQWLGDIPLIGGYHDAADRLLDNLPDRAANADLMHGLGGAILGLLAMARSLPALSRRCLARAKHYGEELIALAQPARQGWHWPTDEQPLGLCGLSHGNAGIALAFAALQRQAPSPVWRQAIEAALAYEALWYLPDQGNWPYLFPEDTAGFDDRPTACGMAWCHGAPGIALSRLTLWHLSGNRDYRHQALSAFSTVARDLGSPRSQAGVSYTLCHGPAGNADMLLDAARRLTQPRWERLARRIARQAVERQAGQWRSGLGVSDGHALGLMLGLAGSGYFVLRCAVRRPLPSLMLPFGLLEERMESGHRR
ncbi:lanthionine synthetase LanC family protein [Halomonas sp. V046]|uniref:lanthionine synthetase LanC family protein n=1 Tax=Halomonas sp. V046 TaxID=3459611 RepID=UPI004044D4E7